MSYNIINRHDLFSPKERVVKRGHALRDVVADGPYHFHWVCECGKRGNVDPGWTKADARARHRDHKLIVGTIREHKVTVMNQHGYVCICGWKPLKANGGTAFSHRELMGAMRRHRRDIYREVRVRW